MKCKYPQEKFYVKRGTKFPYTHRCGQCLHCRITKRATIATRLYLEALSYPGAATFVSLTYALNNRPQGLQKRDINKFARRLRRYCDRKGISFDMTVTGEYGTLRGHPHYHIALYGIPWNVTFSLPKKYQKVYQQLCRRRHHAIQQHEQLEQLLLTAWNFKGFVNVGEITTASAAYIAKYVTKGLDDAKQVPTGWQPEFVSWSRKNSPGKIAAQYIADCMQTRNYFPEDRPGLKRDKSSIAVPWKGLVQVEGRQMPIDRYMKNKVIDFMGGDQLHEDTKQRRNFLQSMQERNRPYLKPENRFKPIIDIQLTEQEKQKAKALKWLRMQKVKSQQRRDQGTAL